MICNHIDCKCCQNCSHIEPDIDVKDVSPDLRLVVIRCIHDEVCGEYEKENHLE